MKHANNWMPWIIEGFFCSETWCNLENYAVNVTLKIVANCSFVSQPEKGPDDADFIPKTVKVTAKTGAKISKMILNWPK